MDTKIVMVFCLCDDVLKAFGHQEDQQVQMSDAEVMTTALVAALFFGGNFTLARAMLRDQGYIPKMLGKSRFSRRLHAIKPYFLTLFNVLAEYWKGQNADNRYAIDTFPVSACDNYRIPRARLYQEEAFRGYQASKKRYFYGLKLHLMTTEAGQPVEFFLTPGSWNDAKGLLYFDFDLPERALIVADKIYNHYEMEDVLDTAGLLLRPFRKKNSKRPVPAWFRYLQFHFRKMIETAGSQISKLWPKKIHTTSALGFELKVVLFVLAASVNFLFPR